MKINFKFLAFCLLAMLLGTSYHTAIHAPTTAKGKSILRKKKTSSSSSSSLIHQGSVQVPAVGKTYLIKDLFAIINTNNPQWSSNFIITPDGVNSYGAAKFGFDANWARNNTTVVRLSQDISQIQRLINSKALPSGSMLSLAQTNASNALYTLLKHISDNYPKIMLYFNAVSPENGNTYRLYIADPCPGMTNWPMVIQGRLNPQTSIPAYTNVLSKWKLN